MNEKYKGKHGFSQSTFGYKFNCHNPSEIQTFCILIDFVQALDSLRTVGRSTERTFMHIAHRK